MFSYPAYIVEQTKGEQINSSQNKPVYISLLKTDRGYTIFDIRLWRDGEPTGCGVYIQDAEAALKLLNALKDYIAEGGEKGPRRERSSRESITDVLGYNPFEEE